MIDGKEGIFDQERRNCNSFSNHTVDWDGKVVVLSAGKGAFSVFISEVMVGWGVRYCSGNGMDRYLSLDASPGLVKSLCRDGKYLAAHVKSC